MLPAGDWPAADPKPAGGRVPAESLAIQGSADTRPGCSQAQDCPRYPGQETYTEGTVCGTGSLD